MARMVWLVGLLSLVMGALGCAENHAAHCVPAEVLACACSDGRMGLQSCRETGLFAPCSCTGTGTCEPGRSFACSCEGGRVGTQTCDLRGSFGSCACGTPGPACVPGLEVACTCAGGEPGRQRCDASGVFQSCECAPDEERCVPGRSVSCACVDGTMGAQVCEARGTYGPCSCGEPTDTGLPIGRDGGTRTDAREGMDARVLRDSGPPTDAPVGDAGPGSGACPEETPPTAPTLPAPPIGRVASGAGSVLEVFPVLHGIVVVLPTAVLLLARSGEELARWSSPREITAASYAEGRLAIADRAAVTTLEIQADALREAASSLLTEECADGVTLTCGRFVCGPSNDWDRVFYTYDLVAGGELARSEPETYQGIPMFRVPGRDAFITVSGGSPSDFSYYRVEPDGTAAFITESPYHGDFAVSERFAFVGRPATHLVTHEGRLLAIGPCHDLPPGTWGGVDDGCLVLDGSLGTLRTGEGFLGMDSGSDGRIYGLVAAAPTSVFDEPACTVTTPCRVQRIDVSARRVVSEGSFAAAREIPTRFLHDGWSGRVVLATGTGCSDSYPFDCTGWAVHVVAYD